MEIPSPLLGSCWRKEILINSSLDKIFAYPTTKTLGDIQNFLTFIGLKEVELRSLGIAFPGEEEEYLSNTLLLYLIRFKLPHFFLIEFSRKTYRPFSSFRQF